MSVGRFDAALACAGQAICWPRMKLTPPPQISRLARAHPRAGLYAAVAAAVAAMALVAMVLQLAALQAPVFLLLAPIVCGAAIFGGLGPALLAVVLGLLVGFAFAPARGIEPYVFVVLGLGVAFAGDWVFRARRSDDQTARVLTEREAHLRSIYDTAPDALIVINAAGIVQSYNASAERMFGWTASEVLGRNVKMLMPQPFRMQHDGYLNRYIDTGERRIIGIGRIVVGERKNGSTFPMELAVGEVRSEHGRVFTGFVRDLTERQATEARLQELQSELVHMSRLSAMGEMASALAHELNQPLSAIANYLSGARRLLERAEVNEPRAGDALEKAADQALRAGEIIRRLREFLARGEGERRVEHLPKLVQEACALALVGVKEHGVRVRYDFAANAERVVADRVQVQQVVLNLVRNAIDAMTEHPRRELVVSTQVVDDEMACVSVADTGPGVDDAAAARLFQPFVTTKPSGMGVGLSISRTIVESHGGRIWTEPNPGGGAIFHFTLRLAPDTALEAQDG